MNRTSDEVFRGLKPAELDRLAAAAYTRRRAHDLDHVLSAAAAPTTIGAAAGAGADHTGAPAGAVRVTGAGRRRVPRRLVAAVAGGAVAVTAIGVARIATGSGAGGPAAHPAPSATAQARAFLLASAVSAAKAPPTSGRYWYSRVRTTYYVDTEVSTTTREPGQAKPVRTWHPLLYTFSSVDESWHDRDHKERRLIFGTDRRFGFPTPAAKAEWERLGRPKLRGMEDQLAVPVHKGTGTKKTHRGGIITHPTDADLAALPADEARLRVLLQNWYHESNAALARDVKSLVGENGQPSLEPSTRNFTDYLWEIAPTVLLAEQVPAGAKAAMYRILAAEPGTRYLGRSADSVGRPGVMLAYGTSTCGAQGGPDGPDGPGSDGGRMIADPSTGRYLEQRLMDCKGPHMVTTFERSGWTDSVHDRP